MLLEHLVRGEGVGQFGALEHLHAAYLLLLGRLVPPHVVDAEAEAGCLVVSAVQEALGLVLRRALVLQFVRQFLVAQLLERNLFFVVLLPHLLEHRLELARLRVAVGALELFEVEGAGGFEPGLDLFVVGLQLCLEFLLA